MEKINTRARLEKRRRKWVMRNILRTSSWIPIMVCKVRSERMVVRLGPDWGYTVAGGRGETFILRESITN